jgi:hypothetical protein
MLSILLMSALLKPTVASEVFNFCNASSLFAALKVLAAICESNVLVTAEGLLVGAVADGIGVACGAISWALSWYARTVNAAGSKLLIKLAMLSILLMSALLKPTVASEVFNFCNAALLFVTVVSGLAVDCTPKAAASVETAMGNSPAAEVDNGTDCVV